MALTHMTTLDEIWLCEVDENPSQSPGVAAPAGSIASIDGGGGVYKKFGAGDTDWVELSDKSTLGGMIGYNLTFGFDGNASSGRWLESLTNVSSDGTSYVFPKAGKIRAISAMLGASSTINFQIYKNISTLVSNWAMTSVQKRVETGRADSFAALDSCSVKVSSGSGSRPVITLFASFD